jgi:CRISPR system Cascade subunit CasD
VTQRWLILDLCAPLMAFGGVAIDHVGPTRDFPAASMLTGLFGNALGWHWSDWQAHQSLQDRLIFAARIDREGRLITDNQNAKLEKNDRGWTTSGAPEGRDGASYDAPHRRRRDYLADARLTVVLRLAEADAIPALDHLAEALNRPARPLFIGRKPCLPTRPMFAGWTTADTAHAALSETGLPQSPFPARAQWPDSEGPAGDTMLRLPDLRNWRSGLHGGTRLVNQGRIQGSTP